MRLFFSALFVCLTTCLTAAPYEIKQMITDPNPKQFAHASGINIRNEVVGKTKIDKTPYDFIWNEKDATRVLPLGNFSHHCPPRINNLGDVAGIFWHETKHWFSASTFTKRIYLVRADGTLTEILPPKEWPMQTETGSYDNFFRFDQRELSVVAINDLGQILVIHRNSEGKVDGIAIWEKNQYSFISPDVMSSPYGFNNQGLVLGQKTTDVKEGKVVSTLVTYDPVTKTTKQIAKDVKLFGAGLNDKGDIFYSEKTTCCMPSKCTLKEQNKLTDLKDFLIVSMNNLNQSIGIKISDMGKKNLSVYLREGNKLTSVAEITMEKDAKTHVTSITDINDNGCMIGTTTTDGVTRPVFFKPTQAPASTTTPPKPKK